MKEDADTAAVNMTDVASMKPVPLIVTSEPTGPYIGAIDVIVGGIPDVTVKLMELETVSPGLVTEIVPDIAPAGTVAVI